jgi:hypothetical protein
MTDTGGGKGFSGSRGKARNNLRNFPGLFDSGGGAPKGGGTRAGAGTVTPKRPNLAPVPPITDPILPLAVWPELIKAGVYEDMFTAPELIYYLQQMARFIQMTPGGVEEMAAEFKVRPDSPFSVLQRKIRQGAPGASAHANRAAGSFQAGSNRWAIDLVKRRDPAVFTVNHVVMAVKRDVDRALVSSPRPILDEYVKQVVDSVISDDPQLELLSARLQKEYTRQLQSFFARFDDPLDWTELGIPVTMKSFPAMLRGND